MKNVMVPRVAFSAFSALVAAVLLCTFAAPSARAADPTDFEKKIVVTPSATALAKIGESTFTDFPVLVRLPAAASAEFLEADGSDLLVTDEKNAALPFEVETFNQADETLVWVKVPSFSASTKLMVYFGGVVNLDNDPTVVWTRYVAVVHGGDAIANAVANGRGLDIIPAL